MPRKWSSQQSTFIDWCDTGEGSCVLIAGAGCGKSTTLEAGARKLTAKGKRVAVVAFNRKIAREMKDKLRDDRNVWVGTVHSFGNRALKYSMKHLDGVEPERKKAFRIFDDVIAKQVPPDKLDALTSCASTIVKLTSLAKQRAVIGAELDDQAEWLEIMDHFDLIDEDAALSPIEIARYARLLLLATLEDSTSYDYDDMLYMPLAKKLSFPRFDVVMVDEAQDTNPARRLIVRRMLKPGGRVIAVGDPRQAIYGFTGADNDALDQIVKEWKAITLPLTTTYRCPKSVVAFASQWVGDHLTAHPTAPGGVVTSSDWQTFLDLARRDISDRTAILPNTAILCRNNAPLVSAAFNLIRNRVPCKIEGRDIADGLKRLANKWRIKSLDTLSERLDAYQAKQSEKLKDKETKLAQMNDQVETLKVIIDQCQLEKKTKLSDLEQYLDSLFGEDVTGMLVLCSIHKSKGLEWDNVYWLDRFTTCPSKFAKKDWQQAQEVNLMYVAATRAKHQLVDLSSPPKDQKQFKVQVVAERGGVMCAAPVPIARTSVEVIAAKERERANARKLTKPEQVALADTLSGMTLPVESNPYTGVLDRLATQGSPLGRRQEPARKKVIERGTSSSHNDEQASIDARFAAGEIDKEERARLHKKRRAQERKQRAK